VKPLTSGIEKGAFLPASAYFTNRECEYYPCHRDMEGDGFNCLFCYCPMYYSICLGEPVYRQIHGALIKDCSGCGYPHRPENYGTIVEYLRLSLSV